VSQYLNFKRLSIRRQDKMAREGWRKMMTFGEGWRWGASKRQPPTRPPYILFTCKVIRYDGSCSYDILTASPRLQNGQAAPHPSSASASQTRREATATSESIYPQLQQQTSREQSASARPDTIVLRRRYFPPAFCQCGPVPTSDFAHLGDETSLIGPELFNRRLLKR
jgi:hypothetical protein